jgi:hypothetical protein
MGKEVVPMRKRIVKAMAVLLIALLGSLSGNALGAPDKGEKSVPLIVHAYAVDQLRFGDVLKIYLEAEDPGDDMMRIATQIDQDGFTGYPTDFIFLKPQYRGHFKGYLTFPTYSASASFLPEWTNIRVRVSVIDKAGNESKEAIFPVVLVSNRMGAPPAPPPFDGTDLPKIGTVMINLINPVNQSGVGSPNWHR